MDPRKENMTKQELYSTSAASYGASGASSEPRSLHDLRNARIVSLPCEYAVLTKCAFYSMREKWKKKRSRRLRRKRRKMRARSSAYLSVFMLPRRINRPYAAE